MPKMQAVTSDDIESLVLDIDQFTTDAADFAERMRMGYSEPVRASDSQVRALMIASRNFAELALAVMQRTKIAEKDAELAELRRQAGKAE